MAETMAVEEFKERYGGKSWTLSTVLFFPVVDLEAGLIEHHELPAYHFLEGFQQFKDSLFRPDRDPLYVDSLAVGHRVRRYRIGNEPSEIEPSFKPEAIDAIEVDGDTVSITYTGCGGFLGAYPGCVHPKFVHSVTVYELTQKLSHLTIHFKRFEKITLGVDNTDNREEGATVFLCDNFMVQQANAEQVEPLYLAAVHLYPKCIYKTTNNCASAMAFAARPAAVQTLVDDLSDWLTQYSKDQDTIMSVWRGVRIPDSLREFTRRAKLEMIPIDDALKVAAAHDVRLISPFNGDRIRGTEQAIVGALAAHGLSDRPREACLHLVEK